jgi:hydrogenase maturation protease
MTDARILIAGVGNIFFGDDAFGVEVISRLAKRNQLREVRLVEFGIRGLDLAYALVEGYEAAILVDATSRGGAPGTLYVIEPDVTEDETTSSETRTAFLDAHAMDPVKVLCLARSLGPLPRILIVGCEPTPPATHDMQMGLSAPVQAAADQAVLQIESLAERLLSEFDSRW